jgi:hypothetical protein
MAYSIGSLSLPSKAQIDQGLGSLEDILQPKLTGTDGPIILSDPSRKLGSDESKQEAEKKETDKEAEKKETEKKDHRFYLYQRVKMPMTKEGKITMHFGLNNETFVSQPVQFIPDLAGEHVIMNINQNGCLEENSCFSVDQNNRLSAIYQEVSYDYFVGDSFLGVNRVRPGELVIDSIKDVPDFYQLPIHFTDKSEAIKHNIVGFAPNSPVWSYWSRVYHFPSKYINVSFSFNNENEYVMLDAAIHHEKEVLFKVKKNEQFYRFNGFMNLKKGKEATQLIKKFRENNRSDEKFGEEASICVANQRDLTMRMTRALFDQIKELLCINPGNCGKVSDLKPEADFTLSLTVENYKDKSVPFMTMFFPSSLYHIDGEDIVWKIDALTPEETTSNCEIILEQHFLKEKYFLVSNPIEDPEYMYIGFKLMEVSDFYKFDFYTITMIILMLVSIALMVIYIILNQSLKKLLRKENLEA